jgi:hypothetical protein
MKQKRFAIWLLALGLAGVSRGAETNQDTLHSTNVLTSVAKQTAERRAFVDNWRATRHGQTNPPPPRVVKSSATNLTVEQRRAKLKAELAKFHNHNATNLNLTLTNATKP